MSHLVVLKTFVSRSQHSLANTNQYWELHIQQKGFSTQLNSINGNKSRELLADDAISLTVCTFFWYWQRKQPSCRVLSRGLWLHRGGRHVHGDRHHEAQRHAQTDTQKLQHFTWNGGKWSNSKMKNGYYFYCSELIRSIYLISIVLPSVNCHQGVWSAVLVSTELRAQEMQTYKWQAGAGAGEELPRLRVS